MKRLFAITTVVVLCSALFSVVVYAGAEVQGSWSGKTYLTSNPCDGGQQFLAIGKGHLNLIGAGTWVSFGCLSGIFTTPVGIGSAIITTATGDDLYLNIRITFTYTGDRIGTWHQDEITVGGTGRFKGAQGVSSSDGFFNWLTEPGEPGVWNGTNTEGQIEF